VLAVNLTGMFLMSKHVVPHMRARGRGSILNMASVSAYWGEPGTVAYNASKGGVLALTRAMAQDHGPEGIRVNCVCPGPTDTPLLEPYFGGAADPVAERRAYEAMQLHGRLVTAEEIADAVAYLASPGASSTMGAALVVDGGYIVR
jgi:2-keto-3-deoxy-L-fuconate dehydrogenase